MLRSVRLEHQVARRRDHARQHDLAIEGQVGRAGEVAGVWVSVILFLLLGSDRIAFCLQGLDIGVQTIETSSQAWRVCSIQWLASARASTRSRRPALRMPAATDEACAFKNFKCLEIAAG